MFIQTTPKKVLSVFLTIILCLLVPHLLGLFSKLYLGYGRLLGVIPFFDFGAEKNLPTLYASLAILFASALLAIIGINHKQAKDRYVLWLLLSAIFFFLSIDELFSIHEQLVPVMRDKVDASGYFYFAWVIPYALALLALAVLYFKFLLRLPKKTMQLFIFSGGLFVMGAIGMEMLGGKIAEVGAHEGVSYALTYTMEELLEKLGIAFFIYALLDYMVEQNGELKFEVTN
ncbi:hypothetical protein NM22_12940 [Vibrio tubiashii]|nr:hypothetical protein NM22_12940 [Vibrio tubiashii]